MCSLAMGTLQEQSGAPVCDTPGDMLAFARAPCSLGALSGPGRALCPRRCGPTRRRRACLTTTCVLRGTATHAHMHDEAPIRRMALISDVHVFDSQGIWGEDVTQFFGQRLLGLLNIVALRGPGTYDHRILEAALDDMRNEEVQHLVVAGDVSNLSIDSEFALAARIFERFGDQRSMTFCPGNHDTYNRSQRHAAFFRAHFAQYCVSDLPSPRARPDGFPYAHVRGGVLFVVLNTGLPNTARGAVGKKQWEAAEAMLRTAEARDARAAARTVVLVLHHPAQDPSVRGTPWFREIGHDTKDWPRVAQFARDFDVNLVVHGHMHVPYRGVLAGAPRTHVYESGSGTLVTENKSRVARYTVFDLCEKGELQRTYARVWDIEQQTFHSLELPLPPLDASIAQPTVATAGSTA